MPKFKYKSFDDFMQAIINLTDSTCKVKHYISLTKGYRLITTVKIEDYYEQFWIEVMLPFAINYISHKYEVIYCNNPYILKDTLQSASEELFDIIRNRSFWRTYESEIKKLFVHKPY